MVVNKSALWCSEKLSRKSINEREMSFNSDAQRQLVECRDSHPVESHRNGNWVQSVDIEANVVGAMKIFDSAVCRVSRDTESQLGLIRAVSDRSNLHRHLHRLSRDLQTHICLTSTPPVPGVAASPDTAMNPSPKHPQTEFSSPSSSRHSAQCFPLFAF